MTLETATEMIPKILHFVWVGGTPVPTQYEENMERWKTHHPGWDSYLWKDVPPDAKWRWIVACEHRPVQIADILRVEMVCRYGGVYADLDSWAVQSIEPTIAGLASFAVKNQFGGVDNSIFGAAKGHPWLQRVLTKVGLHYRPGDRIGAVGSNLFIRTGPESYPNFRLFDFGVLNALPGISDWPNAIVYHSQDNSWRK